MSLGSTINHYLHEEPISLLFHGFFWFFLLVFVTPLIGIFLFLHTIVVLMVNILPSFLSTIIKKTPNKNIDPYLSNELAVYVTGCDTGFGRSVSLLLAKRGFIVFSGCLTENGMKQFEGYPSIHTLKVDVTKNEEVTAASTAVSKWLKDSTNGKTRILHAVINNAGIGVGGLVDWCSFSDFEKVMEVNYFGTMRTTKSFLPILKKQASSDCYKDARIINMISMAGLATFPGSSSYFSSKHATEAFSSCLRTEMKPFNIKVITFNPTFHATEMVKQMAPRLDILWQEVNPKVKEDYGVDYFMNTLEKSSEAMTRLSWDASVVEDLLVKSIESLNPKPQVIVGSDGKYLTIILRSLPRQLSELILLLVVRNKTPALMRK